MREPLYRVSFDAATLLREHPPVFRHPHKQALFEIAYPDVAAAAGRIEVTRWAQHTPNPVSLAATLAVETRPDFYDYHPADDPAASVEWHVNFADPRLFAAYGSPLLAQDEMQVVEHPLLGAVREALLAKGFEAKTIDDSTATPVLVRNVERRVELATNPDAAAGRPHGLYGKLFAAASLDAVRRAARRVEPPTFSNVVAMAAPSGGRGDYTERQIMGVFATACTAFAAAVQESSASEASSSDRPRVVIHSGFWGCGAFGGDRRLMVALQVLAARATNVDRLVLHSGDAAGAEEAQRGIDAADGLALRCGSPCPVDKIVGRAAMLGYRWGVGDGN